MLSKHIKFDQDFVIKKSTKKIKKKKKHLHKYYISSNIWQKMPSYFSCQMKHIFADVKVKPKIKVLEETVNGLVG